MADSSIQVVVRVRPLNEKEVSLLAPTDTSHAFQGDGGLAASPSKAQNAIAAMRSNYIRNIIAPVDDRVLVFDPVEPDMMRGGESSRTRSSLSHMQFHGNGRRPRDVRYAFDRVFPSSTQQREVYRDTVEPMLSGVLSGFNASVFAYGATGCGKTHTISGTPTDPGLIFLTMQGLYERIEAESSDFETNVRLSYLEIYNETIRDLLSETPTPAGRGLALREDAASKMSVVGITEHIPESPEQVLEMITEGNKRRTQSPTEANAVSSRSHAVLQVNVMRRPRTADTVEEMYSASLNIIDLAGSERASATSNQGIRMKEGANINRSLLALGSCINALCQSGTRGARSRHIPYRNSKLTRLLKFSLGGNCKTVMIACVSPSSAHYDETHNTLKYANQAKNIQTKVSRNLLHIDRHVAQYVQAIASLRAEVAELKDKLAHAPTESHAERDTQLEQARARLATSAAQAKEHVGSSTYAASFLAHATQQATQARLSAGPPEAEERILQGLWQKCEAAPEAGPWRVPTVPHHAPPLVAQHGPSAALYDAYHAKYAADVRAHANATAKEALEHLLLDVLSPRMVTLVQYAARAASALQQVCASDPVPTDVEKTLADGVAMLKDLTGADVPTTVRRGPRPGALASPARFHRKSPRRRALRPPPKPAMDKAARAPRASLVPRPSIPRRSDRPAEAASKPRASLQPPLRMPVQAVPRASRDSGPPSDPAPRQPASSSSPPTAAKPPAGKPPAAPHAPSARRGLFQRQFLARRQEQEEGEDEDDDDDDDDDLLGDTPRSYPPLAHSTW